MDQGDRTSPLATQEERRKKQLYESMSNYFNRQQLAEDQEEEEGASHQAGRSKDLQSSTTSPQERKENVKRSVGGNPRQVKNKQVVKLHLPSLYEELSVEQKESFGHILQTHEQTVFHNRNERGREGRILSSTSTLVPVGAAATAEQVATAVAQTVGQVLDSVKPAVETAGTLALELGKDLYTRLVLEWYTTASSWLYSTLLLPGWWSSSSTARASAGAITDGPSDGSNVVAAQSQSGDTHRQEQSYSINAAANAGVGLVAAVSGWVRKFFVLESTEIDDDTVEISRVSAVDEEQQNDREEATTGASVTRLNTGNANREETETPLEHQALGSSHDEDSGKHFNDFFSNQPYCPPVGSAPADSHHVAGGQASGEGGQSQYVFVEKPTEDAFDRNRLRSSTKQNNNTTSTFSEQPQQQAALHHQPGQLTEDLLNSDAARTTYVRPTTFGHGGGGYEVQEGTGAKYDDILSKFQE